MKKNTIILFSILILIALSVIPIEAHKKLTTENENILIWTEYKNTPPILDIAIGDNYVWGAHTEGAIRWHKQNQTYTNFTQANGLIDSHVNAIEVDSNGNVWFGTPSGLSRLSGTSWTHFTTSNGLTNNNVRSLSLGPNGELLVGTAGGLSIYSGGVWHTYVSDYITDPYGCLDSSIVDAAIDSSGNIWISTGSSPTCYFDGSIWDIITYNYSSISSDQIEFNANGDLWLAGVYYQGDDTVMRRQANGTWTRYTMDDGLLGDTTSLTIDSNGHVWVGSATYLGGVNQFNGSTWFSYSQSSGYYGGSVYAIEADETGDIWTGGANNGSRFHDNSWQAYLTGPPRGLIYEMTFDQDGHLWMGLSRAGAVEYDGEKWTQYTKAHGLAGDDVVDIFADGNGDMWFACHDPEWEVGRGITHYDGINWETITTDDGLASNYVQDLAMDNNGDLWVVHRYSSGIDRKTDTGWINYTSANGLLFDRASVIYPHNNSVWVGYHGGYASESGASQFDGSNWINYTSELPYDEVTNFTTTPDGNLFALAGYGVNEFNGTIWSGYAIPSLGYDYSATEAVFDKDGVLWVARQQDLLRYDGENWELYDESNTPVSRMASDIAVNPAGNEIWINSQAGVVKLQVFNVSDQVFLPVIQK